MVGGAYISGTASEIATRGLVNTVAPIAYNVGLAIGKHILWILRIENIYE